MSKKLTLVVGVLMGLGLGLGIMSIRIKRIQVSKPPVVEAQNRVVYRIKGTSVSLNKGMFVIGDDGESSRPSLSISNKEYPNLFFTSEDAMADQISVEGVSDTKNKNEYAVITRERFSAASFVPGYFIIVNLNTRKVIYESPKAYTVTRFTNYSFSKDGSELSMLWNPYYYNSSVTNTMLPLVEFASFDKTSEKFILSNIDHKVDFNDLLKQYESFEINCSYHGQKMSATDVVKRYGEDKKCDDTLDPSKFKYDPDGFITVGQFEKIRKNIKKILNGENIAMIES